MLPAPVAPNGKVGFSSTGRASLSSALAAFWVVANECDGLDALRGRTLNVREAADHPVRAAEACPHRLWSMCARASS